MVIVKEYRNWRCSGEHFRVFFDSFSLIWESPVTPSPRAFSVAIAFVLFGCAAMAFSQSQMVPAAISFSQMGIGYEELASAGCDAERAHLLLEQHEQNADYANEVSRIQTSLASVRARLRELEKILRSTPSERDEYGTELDQLQVDEANLLAELRVLHAELRDDIATSLGVSAELLGRLACTHQTSRLIAAPWRAGGTDPGRCREIARANFAVHNAGLQGEQAPAFAQQILLEEMSRPATAEAILNFDLYSEAVMDVFAHWMFNR